MNTHPLALVHPDARIGRDVTIGPFCVIEANSEIGDGCILESHAVVKSGVTLGRENHIFEGAVLGGLPQHLRAPEHVGTVVIGDCNTIREHATVHRGLSAGHVTSIGDNNLFMVGSHVAHDCVVGNNTIFANDSMLGGHVVVEDRAYISGNVCVHQFCRVGRFAMIGGQARIVRDVPPYVTIDGQSGFVVGLNTIGLRRNSFTTEQIADLKAAYRLIYRSGLKWEEIQQRLFASYPTGPASVYVPFFAQGHRGIVQERRAPPGATIRLQQADEAPQENSSLRSKAG